MSSLLRKLYMYFFKFSFNFYKQLTIVFFLFNFSFTPYNIFIYRYVYLQHPFIDKSIYAPPFWVVKLCSPKRGSKNFNYIPLDISFLIPFLSVDTIQGLSPVDSLLPLYPYHLFYPHYHNNKSFCHNHTSSYIYSYYNLVLCPYPLSSNSLNIQSLSIIIIKQLCYVHILLLNLPESLRLHYQ